VGDIQPPRERAETIHTIRQSQDSFRVARLQITVEREPGLHESRVLLHDGDQCRIGSHESNDVVVKDPTVSRFHLKLIRQDGHWELVDNASMNGTRLDGVRVRAAELGLEGGTISIGDSLLRVRPAGEGKETALTAIPAFGQLAGVSVPMRRLFMLLDKLKDAEIPVLIEGESGTGKELVANEIVMHSPRAEKPFVVVDCGAISPSLVESELFGHVRGAFTGADRDRVGAFEAADGGTVFLDELGELPLDLQPKLLRALEAKEIRRVGESRSRKVNVRVIAATNRELEREVNKGRFREDLFFRLAVLRVNVPPLRERTDDLILLIRVFLQQIGKPEEERLFTQDVLAEMARHDWPGNVRELRNYVERSVVLKSATGSLPPPRADSSGPNSTSPQSSHGGTPGPGQVMGGADGRLPFKIAKDAAVDAFERQYLSSLLAAAQGNMSKAARMAGMDRMYLHRLVQKHGLRGGGTPGGNLGL